MKCVLVNPPLCRPFAPPLALAALQGIIKAHTDCNIEVIDANLLLYHTFLKNPFHRIDKHYQAIAQQFIEDEKRWKQANLTKEQPDGFNLILKTILNRNPDAVIFSLLYDEQLSYTKKLTTALKENNIQVLVGGPAIDEELAQIATTCKDETQLVKELTGKDIERDLSIPADYRGFPLHQYYTPDPVIMIKTSESCYYKQCTFCTHHQFKDYQELPVEAIEKTIDQVKAKNIFLTDDLIHPERLKQLCNLFKTRNVQVMCQLRPRKEYTKELLKEMYDAGFRFIAWGIESFSQRILDLMKKDTNVEDIKEVLQNSKDVGIKNIGYFILGFPSETKEEALTTINTAKEINTLDLIHVSPFSLNHCSPVDQQQEVYGIQGNEERYEVQSGLSQQDVEQLIKEQQEILTSINILPQQLDYLREHCFFFSNKLRKKPLLLQRDQQLSLTQY